MSKADTIPYSGKEGDGENVAATLAKYASQIAEVKSKLAPDAKLTATTDDVFVYRFLRAHKNDVAKAASALSATLKFRADNKLDEIRAKAMAMEQEKFPHADKMAQYAPMKWMHKTDKKGRPCQIDVTGHSRPSDFTKAMSIDDYKEFAFYQLEKLMGTMEEMQKSSGVVMRCVQIMDVSGLGLKHLDMNGLAYVEATSNIFTAHYPDSMAELFVVNAPWLFNTFWRFASSWMSEELQKSTHVYPDCAKLTETFPLANLPVSLGGSCKCAGGCVRELDPLAGFTKLEIKAKDFFALKIDNVEKGSLISWEYRSSHEIGQGASFTPKGEAKITLVENKSRRSDLRGIDGGFEAKKDGLLVIGWQNTDATPKTVWYRLDIKKANQLDTRIAIDTSALKTG
jgi:hypothetical protein